MGMQNAAALKTLRTVALGFERNARSLAQEINGTHLMDNANWKEAFLDILNDEKSTIHISKPVSNTQWEISTLYSQFGDKFKQKMKELYLYTYRKFLFVRLLS
jgi:hypothetical protein